MNIEVRIRSADLGEAVHGYVERRLQFSLGRFANRLGRITVRIADVNGPRGGVDKVCRITAERVPSGHVLLQESVDSNLFTAIDQATDRIGRSFTRALQRDVELNSSRESIRTR